MIDKGDQPLACEKIHGSVRRIYPGPQLLEINFINIRELEWHLPDFAISYNLTQTRRFKSVLNRK